MREVLFYNAGAVDDALLQYAVIISRYQGRWVWCLNKKRKAWEVPGGRREENEAIDDTAKRELYEETGALSFSLKPVCVYSVLRETERFGMLYYADIETLGPLPESEIERIDFFEENPANLSFPAIQPKLMKRVRAHAALFCRQCAHLGTVLCGDAPLPFYGSGVMPVMLVGHSPATRVTRKSKTVLNMDIEKGHLYKYIHEHILQPLGVSKEQIYATNLIKCFTAQLPEELNKTRKGIIADMAARCLPLLEAEIAALQPRLIVSLSGRVFEILSRHYMQTPMKIRENAGKLFNLDINGVRYPYVPVIHIPKSKRVYEAYIPRQTQNLREIRQMRRLCEIGERSSESLTCVSEVD